MLALIVIFGAGIRKADGVSKITAKTETKTDWQEPFKRELNFLLNKQDDRNKKDIEKIENKVAETPKPEAKTEPVVAYVVGAGVEQYRSLVAKYSWNVDYALAIMACESGGNINAVNWEDARITGMPSNGLFQINSYQDWNWNDPETNIARAYEMWSRRGWQPWSCSRKI